MILMPFLLQLLTRGVAKNSGWIGVQVKRTQTGGFSDSYSAFDAVVSPCDGGAFTYHLWVFLHVYVNVCVCACMHACSVVTDSLQCHGLAHQAPLSMGFPRQEYWSGCHFLLQEGTTCTYSPCHLCIICDTDTCQRQTLSLLVLVASQLPAREVPGFSFLLIGDHICSCFSSS